MTIEAEGEAGPVYLRVAQAGQVKIDNDDSEGLNAYDVELTLPRDTDGRERVVRKRIIHYAPHGWRRLLNAALAAVV